MGLLQRPVCSECSCGTCLLVKTPGNFIRVAISVAIGMIFAEVVPVYWACPKCGKVILARGTRVLHETPQAGE